jgi:hypothetical protein
MVIVLSPLADQCDQGMTDVHGALLSKPAARGDGIGSSIGAAYMRV